MQTVVVLVRSKAGASHVHALFVAGPPYAVLKLYPFEHAVHSEAVQAEHSSPNVDAVEHETQDFWSELK